MSSAAFDRIAERYDALWTQSLIGRCQRAAVWNWLDPLIAPGNEILDLGCGTGEDALHLHSLGARVLALDASAEMVRIARSRSVNARQLRVENLDSISGTFDGAISNFGVLNCVREVATAARSLARLIRHRGFLTLCLMGRYCAWEMAHFVRRAGLTTALRRWRKGGTLSSLGIHVTYPSVRAIIEAFRPTFQLMRWTGIGVCVPPSYVSSLSPKRVARLAKIDRRISHWPLFRALADHWLFLFKRL